MLANTSCSINWMPIILRCFKSVFLSRVFTTTTHTPKQRTALVLTSDVVWTWETSQHWRNSGKASSYKKKYSLKMSVSVIVCLPRHQRLFLVLSLCFPARCNAAPSWLACRRQLEIDLCHREPVLLPWRRGFGPLHQWGLPHGGRHSSDV